MTLSLLFWLLMLLWLLFGAAPLFTGGTASSSAGGGGRTWSGIGGRLLPFLAVATLGWHIFGPVVQG